MKKVENGDIGYLLSGYRLNLNEDAVVVWVDLLGNKKEYVHLYKRLGNINGLSKKSKDVKVENNVEDVEANNQSK